MSETQASQQFQVCPQHFGATILLTLGGEFDIAGEKAFAATFQAVCGLRPEHVVLDLGELTFIDSSGLRSLLSAQRHAESEGFGFAVIPSGTEAVRQVFRISGLDKILPVVADEATRDDAMVDAA